MLVKDFTCHVASLGHKTLQVWLTLAVAFLCLARFGDLEEGAVRRHDGASSDGYLAHIFRHAAKELFSEDVGEVTYRTLRSACAVVLIFWVGGPAPALGMCMCLGLGIAVLFLECLPATIERPFVFVHSLCTLLIFQTQIRKWPLSLRKDAGQRPPCLLCRNKDFQEVTLERDGEVLLRFAAAYGFRNIQNMVLKLKKGRFPHHFVEVLACAGGEAWAWAEGPCTAPQETGPRGPPAPLGSGAIAPVVMWWSFSSVYHLIGKSGW